MTRAAFSPVVYRVRVTLEGTDPPVWRLLEVPGRFSLAQLHDAIQVAMGWEDDHLHGFEIDGTRYGPRRPDPPGPFRRTEQDERKTRLAGVVHRVGATFRYTYDFGDSWDHIVEIEDVADPDTDTRRVTCLTGERACPPEDCGGIPGYYQLIEVMDDPDHPDYEVLTDELGGIFNPERFDLERVNHRLNATIFT